MRSNRIIRNMLIFTFAVILTSSSCCLSALAEAVNTWISSGLEYECIVCGMTSDSIPGIMSLPDPEIEAYLASLSDEEFEEFIASLLEDQVARVTALMPSDDEHLTE